MNFRLGGGATLSLVAILTERAALSHSRAHLLCKAGVSVRIKPGFNNADDVAVFADVHESFSSAVAPAGTSGQPGFPPGTMASAIKPMDVDGREEAEEQLYLKGPLSVLTSSVKTNSMVRKCGFWLLPTSTAAAARDLRAVPALILALKLLHSI